MSASKKTNAAEEIVEDLEEDSDVIEPVQYSITSYGADFLVDGLVSRIKKGDILIPDFQRQYVWSATQASRFIESLLLGLPVPGIFLSKEDETNKLLVIDGQQRLRTLRYFYEGSFEEDPKRPFILKGVQKQFIDLTYKTLPESDRRRLDDSVIHATVISQDHPSQDKSSIYHIFERLNTGGTPLQAQEIRSALYHGAFDDLLGHLNLDSNWREVFGQISGRMKDQELILRFFALYFSSATYSAPMLGFLNDFMAANRNLKLHSGAELESLFRETISLVRTNIGPRAFRPKRALNAAVFDAVMVGIGRNHAEKSLCDASELEARYNALLGDPAFTAVTETGTSQELNVAERLRIAIAAFAKHA